MLRQNQLHRCAHYNPENPHNQKSQNMRILANPWSIKAFVFLSKIGNFQTCSNQRATIFLMITITRGTHWYTWLCHSMYGCGDMHHFMCYTTVLVLHKNYFSAYMYYVVRRNEGLVNIVVTTFVYSYTP